MSILGVAFFCEFWVEFEKNYTRRKLWKESMSITARTVAGKVVFQGVNARILPCDNYTDANKYYTAVGKICNLFEDYAGFPKFYHPRYILKNMATFDPIGWLESLPSSIGFVLSLIVFLAAIAEVFYFTFDIENPFIGIIVGITVSSIVNVLVWLVIASIWGVLLWILDHFIILDCYLYNCSIDNHNKNLVLADSGMERIFLEDFSLWSKVLIWIGLGKH